MAFGQIPEWQLHFWKLDRTNLTIHVEVTGKICIINYHRGKGINVISTQGLTILNLL